VTATRSRCVRSNPATADTDVVVRTQVAPSSEIRYSWTIARKRTDAGLEDLRCEHLGVSLVENFRNRVCQRDQPNGVILIKALADRNKALAASPSKELTGGISRSIRISSIPTGSSTATPPRCCATASGDPRWRLKFRSIRGAAMRFLGRGPGAWPGNALRGPRAGRSNCRDPASLPQPGDAVGVRFP